MIQRKTPLKRKRATKRKSTASRCSVKRCAHRSAVQAHVADCVSDAAGHSCEYRLLCLTHAKQEADRLFSLRVRSVGECEKCGATDGLQCSHFLSRRYLGTRYNPLNAECLCLRCHKFFTEHPIEAGLWAEHRLGAEPLAELRRIALAFAGPLDYARVLEDLQP